MPFDPDAPATAGRLYGLPFTPEEARLHLVPVPWEATTSYRRGTVEGPSALLAASAQVDLHDIEYGDFWREGIVLLDEDPRIREWNAAAEVDARRIIAGEDADPAHVNALGELVNTSVYRTVCQILDSGRVPGIIGGDHSAPFGAIRAVAERHPGVGVLHIDAHADLRDAYEGFTWSHASIMYNVLRHIPAVSRIVQVGIRDIGAAEMELMQAQPDRLTTVFDADVGRRMAEGETFLGVVREALAQLPPKVYISFDVDGLDPALCPGTGTPVPGGLSFREACVLLQETSMCRQIVGFDLNEIGPSEWDGNVAARLLYKMCGATLRSAGRSRGPP